MVEYKNELRKLQIELVKLQKWVQEEKKRILIIFEGRDSAGKGGAIRRFTRFLNPRAMRIVALPKPTEYEKGQWFFQRYIAELPSAGEMVFFDRSWYNRAVVEPVMKFCTKKQYEMFLSQVVQIEQMLTDDGLIIFKFWFSIDINEQKRRLRERNENLLKQWKLSTVDVEAQKKWSQFTEYKKRMFENTHTESNPWIIIKGNNKQYARIESIRYVLSKIDYTNKLKERNLFKLNPQIIGVYDRSIDKITGQ